MISKVSVTNLLTVLFLNSCYYCSKYRHCFIFRKTPSKILFSVHTILNWCVLFMPVKPEIVFCKGQPRDSLKRIVSSKLNRAKTGRNQIKNVKRKSSSVLLWWSKQTGTVGRYKSAPKSFFCYLLKGVLVNKAVSCWWTVLRLRFSFVEIRAEHQMAADKITVLFPRSNNHNAIQRGVFSPTTKLNFFFLTPWSNTVFYYFATLS